MSRTQFTFACEGAQLAATLDDGEATTGLLIVSGGNELRSGAFAGQARLAREIAAQGFPVLRFDRRGVGDSEGENRGFEQSGEDITAAVAAFEHKAPQVTRIIAFGNCDAASALMLNAGAGCDGLVLSNPWTFDEVSAADEMPAEAVRARYIEKLRNPSEIKRLLTGGVSFRKLFGGLKAAASKPDEPTGLAQSIRAGLESYTGNVRIVIAERDRTAQAFLANWEEDDSRIHRCAGATHAYVEPDSFAWLKHQILAALADK